MKYKLIIVGKFVENCYELWQLVFFKFILRQYRYVL